MHGDKFRGLTTGLRATWGKIASFWFGLWAGFGVADSFFDPLLGDVPESVSRQTSTGSAYLPVCGPHHVGLGTTGLDARRWARGQLGVDQRRQPDAGLSLDKDCAMLRPWSAGCHPAPQRTGMG